jgi:AraC-like DNA-binding protein
MNLSPSSDSGRDPLSDVLDVLGATVSRSTRLEASGAWALAFPAVDRLKFVAILRGHQWMLLPGMEPVRLAAGDVCLLGRTPFVVASDPGVPPVDGRPLYAAPGCDVARIAGDDTISVGGTVTFSTDHADFLLDKLPDFMWIPRAAEASGTIAAILALFGKEMERDAIGGGIVSARLADILVVEAIRAHLNKQGEATGWLGALVEPRLGRALRALHANVARPWTVEQLAAVACMSRASFAAEFTRRLGQPPLAYLRTWRLARARMALEKGTATVAHVANDVGYRSQSAFSQAYRVAFGVTPTARPKPGVGQG